MDPSLTSTVQKNTYIRVSSIHRTTAFCFVIKLCLSIRAGLYYKPELLKLIIIKYFFRGDSHTSCIFNFALHPKVSLEHIKKSGIFQLSTQEGKIPQTSLILPLYPLRFHALSLHQVSLPLYLVCSSLAQFILIPDQTLSDGSSSVLQRSRFQRVGREND
jgi:hypothetical protein